MPARPTDTHGYLLAILPGVGVVAVAFLSVWWVFSGGAESNIPARVVPALMITGLSGFVGVLLAARSHYRFAGMLAAERARLENELATQAATLAASRRQHDLGTLASGIAHELGQPLSAARVDIEGLHLLRQLGREPDPAHATRVLARVGTCILAMTQIVNHLRDLASDPLGQPDQPVEIGAVVAAVLADRGRWDATGALPIAVDGDGGPVLVLGDPMGVRLILVNLLRNACEAVAGRPAAASLVRIGIGPGPRLVVSDSGAGIDPADLPQIFEPFVSSKGRARGIGLSLARASAERMGARIDVESRPGMGATFTVLLRSAR